MKLSSSKKFYFSMDVAWEALHKASQLDVEPGSTVKVISDTQWEAHSEESGSVTVYTASFDEAEKKVVIEGTSQKKHEHDFIYLTLIPLDDQEVQLDIEVQINTGVHFIAKALGALIAKPAQEIISKHIYHNFEALCTGQETKTMTSEELKELAKKHYEK